MNNQMTMTFRVDHSEFYDGKHVIVGTTPAKDEFSRPSSFRLRSDKPFSINQTVDVLVEVSGYVRKQPYEDKKTKESKIFYDGVVYWDVIEVLKVHAEKSVKVAKTA